MEFAQKAGISQSYVSDLIYGAKTPSLHMAYRIYYATETWVGFTDWITRDEAISIQAAVLKEETPRDGETGSDQA